MRRVRPATKKTKSRARPSGAKQRKIVESVLAQVPFDGWTDAALIAGAKACGLSRKEIHALLSGGIKDVIRLFGELADEAMQTAIKKERGFATMRVREKVAFAVKSRLEFLTPHREAMKRLIIWYAMPKHASIGVKRVYKTVDMIWQAAGDISTDYNFYTKRILLAGVMKATMLFWLGDETPGCSATWEFLDRRIAEVVRAGKSLSLLREWTPGELVNMLRDRLNRTA